MSAQPAAKRARAPAIDAAVSTVVAPGLGLPNGLFVLADGTLLACAGHSIRVLAPSGLLPACTLAGHNDARGKHDGPGAATRFNSPQGITVDPAGNVVVVDSDNNALRLVSKAGAVSTLAGGGGMGFADARFNHPQSVVVTANGDYVMTDHGNHVLRVVTPGGAVRTLAGNGQPGFADGQGAAARFNFPVGLAVDVDESILVTEIGNHAVRRVTMAGLVSTVAGNGQQGYADGEGAGARFNNPTAVVVDKEGTILVADKDNNRLRRLTGRHVTTLAGGSEAGTADGAGPGARFTMPNRLALDERGRLLVVEVGRADTLRVVEASLVPPPWMGPVDPVAQAAAQAHEEKAQQMEQLLGDYGKLVEAPELADVVLVVEGERFPAHRLVLAARSEYFRGLLLSGMQEGSGHQDIELGEVSARAFRVVLRHLYTAEVPAWGEAAMATSRCSPLAQGFIDRPGSPVIISDSDSDDECVFDEGRAEDEEQGDEEAKGEAAEGAGNDAGGGGGASGRAGNGGKIGKGKGKGKGKGGRGGQGGAAGVVGGEGEGAAGGNGLVREVLKAADMLQAEGLLKHCLEAFRCGLTVNTAIENLVWAHTHGPEEARGLAMAYVVQHIKTIQSEAQQTMDLLESLSELAVQVLKQV